MMPKVLVIIFGEVRTLAECALSIYTHLVLVNRPCYVMLAIDGSYDDIPKDVMTLFRPVLYDIYVTHNKEASLQRDNQRIEFCLVEQALRRIQHDLDEFEFIAKVRTDIFLRHPIDIRTAYGRCSYERFSKAFTTVMDQARIDWRKDPVNAVKAWFLTGGIPYFVSKQLDVNRPPHSPWSISNVYEWNQRLFQVMEEVIKRRLTVSSEGKKVDLAYLHVLIRMVSQNERVVYLIGSTWIHYGLKEHIVDLSLTLSEKHTTMKWAHLDDDQELSWTDHKGKVRSKKQSEWRLITDDQMRMVHHLHGYALIDLVNPTDYIESFDARRTHQQNKKDPKTFAWIVRKRQLSPLNN